MGIYITHDFSFYFFVIVILKNVFIFKSTLFFITDAILRNKHDVIVNKINKSFIVYASCLKTR